MCDKAAHLSNAEFLQPEKTQFYLTSVTQSTATHGMMTRLIAFIGLETIKKIALENKPLKSLLGDQRTKGFFEGKFEAASLEAVLSLEDNFDRLSSEEKVLTSTVRPKFITKTLTSLTKTYFTGGPFDVRRAKNCKFAVAARCCRFPQVVLGGAVQPQDH